MARVYVGGLSGSGKSTACKAVARKLGISYLTGSEIMMRSAGVATREDLDRLPEDVKNDLRLHSFESYYQKTPDLIINGHFYLTGTDIKYFDAYVLVEVDTERLIGFRQNDETRQRSLEPSVIDQEKAQLENRVDKLVSKFGVKIIRIKNNGTLGELANSIEGVYLSYVSTKTKILRDR